MKDWWNKELAIKAFYLFLALAATFLFGIVVWHIGDIWSFIKALIAAVDSFIIGFAIAYILYPSYMFIRTKIFGKIIKNGKEKTKKSLSILTLYVVALGLFTVLMYFVIPQFIISIVDCVNNLINNYDTIYGTINDFIKSIGGSDSMLSDTINSISQSIFNYLKSIDTGEIMKLTSVASSVISTIFSVFIGVIISIYMLYNKEKFCAQIKKTGFAIFSKKTMYHLQRWFGTAHEAFGQYLIGVVLDAIIVGTIFGVLSAICQIPYAPMIGVVLGFTNMIPFAGPYIGGVPCAVIVLVNDPIKAVILVIMMIVVQQVDANLISPRILSSKTGLAAIWVIFAILVGGYFFGVVGMLIAVPAFSVIYVFFRNFVNDRLERKKLSNDTADYLKDADVLQKYNKED